mmetsp:Transcript_36319/g.54293  ORF Transcript_36319/g.54293 Transcript_36319/m.54293 type:complete len:82 (-) Transcript_36319:142-387(-)
MSRETASTSLYMFVGVRSTVWEVWQHLELSMPPLRFVDVVIFHKLFGSKLSPGHGHIRTLDEGYTSRKMSRIRAEPGTSVQ